MIPEKILEKIKKCMALANDKHATENEAAVALKQAKALMDEYQITDVDLVLSNVKEYGINVAKMLPQWHWNLIHTCGDLFNCHPYQIKREGKKAQIKFIGVGSNAEMCTYAYDVLIRQLKRARLFFIKNKLNRVKITKNKTYRADQFCLGWVSSVRALLTDFIHKNEEQADLIKQYIDQRFNFVPAKMRDVKNISKHVINDSDHYAGFNAGKHAQLHHAATHQSNELFLK
jgi:hypothetical protein